MMTTKFWMFIAFGLTLLLPAIAAAEVVYVTNTAGPGAMPFGHQCLDIDGNGTDDFRVEHGGFGTCDIPCSHHSEWFGIQTISKSLVLMDGDYTAAFDSALTPPVYPSGSQEWAASDQGRSLIIGGWGSSPRNGICSGWLSNAAGMAEAWMAVAFEIDDEMHQGYIHFGLGEFTIEPWGASTELENIGELIFENVQPLIPSEPLCTEPRIIEPEQSMSTCSGPQNIDPGYSISCSGPQIFGWAYETQPLVISTVSVPEPATTTFLLMGFPLLVQCLRRRSRV